MTEIIKTESSQDELVTEDWYSDLYTKKKNTWSWNND